MAMHDIKVSEETVLKVARMNNILGYQTEWAIVQIKDARCTILL